MGAIPIRNVYYLLLYAWDRFTPKSQVEVGAEQGPDLPNLLARVLVEGTHRLLRRGLDRGYIGYVEELAAPRGRFLLAEAVKRRSFSRGLLMRICELILELKLPEVGGHRSRFADILADKDRMPAIFEAFVRNFYRQEQDQFSVGSELIPWDTGPNPLVHENYLPSMRTDVTLRSSDRTIVIDAKFYPQALVSHLGGHQKVRSAHLYQLISYLKNTAHKGGADAFAEGVLLYPCTDATKLRLDFSLVGHRVRVCSVDLTRSWPTIHDEMIGLLNGMT